VPPELMGLAEILYSSDVLPGPEHAPRLRWVQLDTSGIDHARDSALWSGDTTITTLGGISPAPLAEWVMMMVLAHAHHLRTTEHLQAERRWPPVRSAGRSSCPETCAARRSGSSATAVSVTPSRPVPVPSR